MENNTPGTEDSYKQYGRISFEDFKKLYGEDYIDAINIETWKIDRDLSKLYSQIEKELFTAKRSELGANQVIRKGVFPKITENAWVPYAGLRSDTGAELREKVL